MNRNQIFVAFFFLAALFALIFSDSVFAAIPQDPGESSPSIQQKRGTYTCKWNAELKSVQFTPPATKIAKWHAECVVDDNSCEPGGYKPGDACKNVGQIDYNLNANDNTFLDGAEKKEELDKKKKQCEKINRSDPAVCVIAHPTFECQWIPDKRDSIGDVIEKAHCEPKTSCDSAFTESVNCSRLSQANCESGKNIKKVCVEGSGSSAPNSGTSPEKPLSGGEEKSGTITLYQKADYRGDTRTFNSDISDLKAEGFNDKTSSIQISGGTWEVCTDIGYQGKCVAVSGNISNVGSELGINDKISSLRKQSGRSKEGTLDDGKSNESTLGGEFSIKNPLKFGTIPEILNAIAGFLYFLALAVVTIMVLIGAFQILTAAGSPTQVEKGKQTITWAIIGTVVILISGGIADLTANFLGGKAGSSSTSQNLGTAHCEWRAGEGCKAILNCKSGSSAPASLNCSAGGDPASCGGISPKNCVK